MAGKEFGLNEVMRQLNANRARQHYADTDVRLQNEIQHSITHTSIYQEEGFPDSGRNIINLKIPANETSGYSDFNEIKLIACTSGEAIKKFAKHHRVCVLNFASYKNPGGQFMAGSSAQEEALCHDSILYSVLSRIPNFYEVNRNNKNSAAYRNRALYSEDICFEFTNDGITRDKYFVDVLTCAAPNWSTMSRYNMVTKESNTKYLRSRIQFIHDILEDYNIKHPDRKIEVFITGAFGCGVFKQNPNEVASIFKDVFSKTSIHTIVYAIPRDKNLTPFENVFDIIADQ